MIVATCGAFPAMTELNQPTIGPNATCDRQSSRAKASPCSKNEREVRAFEAFASVLHTFPAIFARLDAEIDAEDGRQKGRNRRQHKAAEKPLPPRLMTALEKDVSAFAARIQKRYPILMEYRPVGTKRVILSSIGKRLPPFPRRSGRPEKSEITQAANLKAQQLREVKAGTRKRVYWDEIAAMCIPKWVRMRPMERRRERNRLRNSVAARKRGQAPKSYGAGLVKRSGTAEFGGSTR